MGFDDDFAAAAADPLLDYQGVAVTWHPKGGANIATRGIFVETDVNEMTEGDGRRSERVAELTFPTEDTTDYTGVPAAGIDDTVTIGGVLWSVRGIMDRQSGMAKAVLVISDRVETSRQGYRRGR